MRHVISINVNRLCSPMQATYYLHAVELFINFWKPFEFHRFSIWRALRHDNWSSQYLRLPCDRLAPVSVIYFPYRHAHCSWYFKSLVPCDEVFTAPFSLIHRLKVKDVSQIKMEVEEFDEGSGRDWVLTKCHRVFPWSKCVVERRNHKHNSRISNQVWNISQNMVRWFGRFWHDGRPQ